MTPDEFGAKIKAKYPDYADMDNTELSRRIVAKYPDYASHVEFNGVPTEARPTAPLGGYGEAIRPSGMRDAVSESTYTIAGRSQPVQGGDVTYAPPQYAPERLSLAKALLTNEPVEDYLSLTARGLPSIAGGLLGIPLGLPGVTTAGAGGEGLRQIGVGVYSALRGADVPTGGQVARRMGTEGAINALGYGAAKAIPIIPAAAKRIYDYGAKNLGGMSEATLQTIGRGAEAVAGKVGITKESIGRLGEKMRSSISEAVKKGEDFYSEIVARYSQPGARGLDAKRLNLRDAILPEIEAIGASEGYRAPAETLRAPGMKVSFLEEGPRRISDVAEVEKFNEFRQLAKELGSATPQQVYFFQKDLNKAIRSFKGKPLVVALGKIKGKVNEFIESNAKEFPDLIEGNRAYKAAMELEEDAGKLVNADDAIQYVKNAFNPSRYESQRKDTLLALADRVPELKNMLSEIQVATAAEEAGRLLRPLPQTGFGSAMVAGAGAAAGTRFRPALIAAPAFSPRAYLAGYQLMQSRPAQYIGSGVAAAYSAIPAGVVQAGATTATRYIVK